MMASVVSIVSFGWFVDHHVDGLLFHHFSTSLLLLKCWVLWGVRDEGSLLGDVVILGIGDVIIVSLWLLLLIWLNLILNHQTHGRFHDLAHLFGMLLPAVVGACFDVYYGFGALRCVQVGITDRGTPAKILTFQLLLRSLYQRISNRLSTWFALVFGMSQHV